MFRYSAIVFMLALLPVAYNQFITFKDGKIGVNFLGYHAEAGLGGLLTGNAAHGGLSASAGTPLGQRAAAGLGGSIDEAGRPRGGGFAAASAGAGVGASAALGGSVDEFGGSGGLGSEAHAGGYSAKKVELGQYPQGPRIPPNVKSVEIGPVNSRSSFDYQDAQPQAPANPQYPKKAYRKKYNVANRVRAQTMETNDENNQNVATGATTVTKTVNFQPNPNFFNDIFNIPISALNAVNQFLNNGFNGGAAAGGGGLSVTKTRTKTADAQTSIQN